MHSRARSSNWLAAILSPETLIISLSRGAEKSIGYPPEDLVGRPVTHILADASVFDVPQILETAGKWGCWEGRIAHRTRDGRLIRAQSTVSLLSEKGSRSSGYILTSHLNGHVDSCGSENPVLTEVAANLRTFAHELNNPLAVIMGFTQLLVSDTDCQGRIRADIEKIYSELKRVVQAVERMHDYTLSLCEQQEGDREPEFTVRRA
jgi:PAS domain S-box-containing protein